ncbi:uncharacterized protein LOC107786537 [Nicotiana tabacum]|uniref:Uncharacterized protein LOC107786537 n=1 Tax=Nicotiana tabacum TaxID=4097 RepID=A0AC58TLD0_TOBAC
MEHEPSSRVGYVLVHRTHLAPLKITVLSDYSSWKSYVIFCLTPYFSNSFFPLSYSVSLSILSPRLSQVRSQRHQQNPRQSLHQISLLVFSLQIVECRRALNVSRVLCVREKRYDNEIKDVEKEKKAKKRIADSLFEGREKRKKLDWIREDVWIIFLAIWDSDAFKKKSERAKAARASQKGGSLHSGGSMSFVAHRRRLEKLKGGPVSHGETHKKMKKDSLREGWDRYHRSLDEWCQTQPASDDGTPIQPSPDDMTSIWAYVAGGVSKGIIYVLGVQRPSSFRPSPLFSDAPTAQNQEEMEAMRKQIELLSKRCETTETHIARVDKYMKRHMPHSYDDEETESDV